MKHTLKKLPALLTALALLCSLGTAALADGTGETPAGETDAAEQSTAPQTETVHLHNADDVLRLAENCRLDTWSGDKIIELDNDISLAGMELSPIPSFGGVFRGNGHTISGFTLSGHISNAGFFAVVREGAVVRNLNLSGTLSMADSCETAGGIAGQNYGTLESCSFTGTVSGNTAVGGIVGTNNLTGVVRMCRASGAVYGKSMTGGIAGSNAGIISASTNAAYVNTTGEDGNLSVTDLNLDFSQDMNQLTGGSTAVIADTGGIAGYSSGMLRSCVNNAMVGYQHIGYNNGGIAGRSCGFVDACSSTGTIYGRKDVGGIVGQMEPFILTNLSESTLLQLQTQLQELSDLVDKAADDAQGGVGGVSSRLNSMRGYVTDAVKQAADIQVTRDVSSTVTQDSGSATVSGTVGDSSGSVTVTPGDGSISIDTSTGTVTTNLNGNVQVSATPDLSGITRAINGIGSQLSLLNGSINGAVGTVADDVRAINAKFNELNNTLFDAVFAANTAAEDLITDTSDMDVDLVTLGKVLKCSNTGSVNGDINVGGIAGTMALDSSLDPEGDVSSNLNPQTQSQYEVKAIIQSCTNSGLVTAKRNYAGGICGRMELGLITSCKSFGTVRAENGDYAGGIAGSTAATIRSCYAACSLSGGQYVGGIVGSGVNASLTGAVSTVAGNCSMVDITACTQYAGAVSGANAGEFSENIFVSDTLYGIDGVNYSGRAEAITYAQLLETDGLPEQMKTLTLRFEADGKLLKTLKFSYGDSFGAEVFPAIPGKDGYYGVWDRTDLSTLHFNTVVNVVYTEYTTALTGTDTREDGRPVFLVLGSFDDSAAVTALRETQSVSDFAPLSAGFRTALAHYRQTYTDRSFFTAAINRDVAEQWHLTLPEDGMQTHRVRFLAPDGGTEHLDLFLRTADGGWQRLDCEAFGSYLEFSLTGQEAELAAVTVLPVVWVWCAAIAFAVLLVLVAVLLVRLRLKRRSRPRVSAPAAESSPAKPGKAHRLTFRLWMLPLILCLVIMLTTGIVVWRYVDALGDGLIPYAMLRELSQRSDLSMELTLDAGLGDTETQVDGTLCSAVTSDGRVTGMTVEGVTFYYAGNAVLLENGRAFRLEDSFPDYASLLQTLVPLYKQAEVTSTTETDRTTYSVTLDSSGTETLLNKLLPTLAASVQETSAASVAMTASGGSVQEITISLAGSFNDSAKTTFRVDAVVNSFGSGTLKIPAGVTETLHSGLTGEEPVITTDVLQLAVAWAKLRGLDCAAADLSLAVNCGPLKLSDTLPYREENVDGLRVWNISKNALQVYGSGTNAVTANGAALSGEESLTGPSVLLGAAYTLCLDGDFSRAGTGAGTVYTISLGGDEVKALAETLVPDMKAQSVSFSYGTLTLTLTDGTLSSITLEGAGTVRVVLVDAPVSVNAALRFEPGERFDVPAAALSALQAAPAA